jgi:hypothetical protein
MKSAAAFLSLASIIIFACAPAKAQLVQCVVDNKVVLPLPDSITWSTKSPADSTLDLHFRTRVKPTALVIGQDHPNGTKFLVTYQEYGAMLPIDYPKNFKGFDEFGDLNPGYLVQAGEHYFDHESSPELVIAIGNGINQLAINIFKFHSPKSEKEASDPKYWSLIGSFQGHANAVIDGNKISLPFGSKGEHKQYQMIDGQFSESYETTP